MKSNKYVKAVLTMAFAALLPSLASAFTSKQIVTSTAGVAFFGSGTVSISPELKLASDPINSVKQSSITWSGVTVGTTGWKLSDDVINLGYLDTSSIGGVQIYTDNIASDAGAFAYTGSTTTTDCAGMIEKENTSASPLSLAWSIKTATATIEGGTNLTGVGAADPNTGSTAAVFNNKYQWLFFKDQHTPSLNGNPAFTPGEDYARVLDYRGAHAVQGPDDPNHLSNSQGGSQQFFPEPAKGTDYVYIESNFANAVTPATYATQTLRLEAFTN